MSGKSCSGQREGYSLRRSAKLRVREMGHLLHIIEGDEGGMGNGVVLAKQSEVRMEDEIELACVLPMTDGAT